MILNDETVQFPTNLEMFFNLYLSPHGKRVCVQVLMVWLFLGQHPAGTSALQVQIVSNQFHCCCCCPYKRILRTKLQETRNVLNGWIMEACWDFRERANQDGSDSSSGVTLENACIPPLAVFLWRSTILIKSSQKTHLQPNHCWFEHEYIHDCPVLKWIQVARRRSKNKNPFSPFQARRKSMKTSLSMVSWRSLLGGLVVVGVTLIIFSVVVVVRCTILCSGVLHGSSPRLWPRSSSSEPASPEPCIKQKLEKPLNSKR